MFCLLKGKLAGCVMGCYSQVNSRPTAPLLAAAGGLLALSCVSAGARYLVVRRLRAAGGTSHTPYSHDIVPYSLHHAAVPLNPLLLLLPLLLLCPFAPLPPLTL